MTEPIKTNSWDTLSGKTFHKVEIEITDDWNGEVVFRDKNGRLRLLVTRTEMEYPEKLKFQIESWGKDGNLPSCTVPVCNANKCLGDSVTYWTGLNEQGPLIA